MHNLPVLCISGKTGLNCKKIFMIADDLKEAFSRRVKTSDINRFLKDLLQYQPPPDYGGKEVKLNYITQADTNPPVFVVFTNQPKGIKKSYRRYIEHGLKRLLGGADIPIVIKFRSKS